MLVIKIEAHPGGDGLHPRAVNRIEIEHRASAGDYSSYYARFYSGDDIGASRVVEVGNHRRTDGALELVAKVLKTIGLPRGGL